MFRVDRLKRVALRGVWRAFGSHAWKAAVDQLRIADFEKAVASVDVVDLCKVDAYIVEKIQSTEHKNRVAWGAVMTGWAALGASMYMEHVSLFASSLFIIIPTTIYSHMLYDKLDDYDYMRTACARTASK